MGVSEQPGNIGQADHIEHHIIEWNKEKSSFFAPVIDIVKLKIDDIFKLTERKTIKIKNSYLEELRTDWESKIDKESIEQLKSIFISWDDIIDYQDKKIYENDIRSAINTFYSNKITPVIESINYKTKNINKTIVWCETIDDYNNIDLSYYLSSSEEELIYDVLNASATWNNILYIFTAILNRLWYDLVDFNIKHVSERKWKNQVKLSIQKEIDMLNQN